MLRTAVRLSLTIVLCAAVVPRLPAQQRPVFRSDINFVTVDAYPLIAGRVVEGLTRDDFEMREDGRPQVIESFEYVRADARLTDDERREPNHQQEMLDQLADPRSRAFVAFLDVHHVSLSGAFYSRQPLLELFDRLLAPSDLIALTTSRNHPKELTFGRKSTVARQQLSDFWTWWEPDVTLNDAEESAIRMCFPQQPGLGDAMVARRRQDQLLSALEGTVEYLGEIREGRKTLFLFSQGWTWFEPDLGLLKILNNPGYIPSQGPKITNEPWRNLRAVTRLEEGGRASCETELRRLAALNSPPRFGELLRDATMANVTVYPVDPSGVGGSPGTDRLLEFAANTGGTAVYNRNDLVQGVIDVSREFAGYYLLGYASDNRKTDGSLRRIEVKVKRPGVEVKARRGYRALTSAAVAPVARAPVSPADAGVDAALAALARLDSRDEARVHAYRTMAGASVVVELGAARVGPEWTADIRLVPAGEGEPRVARLRIAAGARSALASVSGPAMAPGEWRVMARLRNAQNPDDGVIELNGDMTDTGLFRSVRGSATFAPAADMRFARSDRLRVEWPRRSELTGAMGRVIDRAGSPTEVPATVTAADGAGVRADVVLAPLAPGDYLVEVRGQDAGSPVRLLAAFRVVR